MFGRKPRFTLDEFSTLFGLVADKVTALNEEARKHNMVESGMLPQAHLSRDDFLKNRQRLELDGKAGLGRRMAEPPDDPDLTARDD